MSQESNDRCGIVNPFGKNVHSKRKRKIVNDFLFLSRNLRNKIIRMKYAIFPEKDIQFLIPIIL